GFSSRVPGAVPPGPLPFERQRVFGLDLQHCSSGEALHWLQSTSGAMPALVALPIDGEVVQALGQEQERELGLAAIDLLVAAARDTPIAACLRKPRDTVGELGVAQAAVEALVERFPNAIAYVSSCEQAGDPSWQRAVARAVLGNIDPPVGTLDALFPLSVGTIAHVRTLEPEQLGDHGKLATGDSRYLLARLELGAPASVELVTRTLDALRNEPTLALVLLRPGPEIDPATMLASIAGVRLADSVAPQGFTNVTAPPVIQSLEWQDSRVGTAHYRRATADGAAMRIAFTGTQLHLIGVVSPDAGRVTVWLDVEPSAPGAKPWAELDLHASQARDVALPLVEDVPASSHQVTLVISGGEVAISGFFTAGKEESGPTSALASLVLLVIAIAALADVCYSAVAEIRARAGVTDRPLPSGEYRR
ncbi:MAG: hypothetical protein DCC58_14395, partial [Chloroflexi bacterium]